MSTVPVRRWFVSSLLLACLSCAEATYPRKVSKTKLWSNNYYRSCGEATHLRKSLNTRSWSNDYYRRKRNSAAFLDPLTVAKSASALAKRSPLAAAFVTCAVNGAAADWIAQSSERVALRNKEEAAARAAAAAAAEGSNNEDADASLSMVRRGGVLPRHDYKRSLAFILYGGCYQGAALELIYNGLFTQIFGAGRALVKVAVSQFIMAPLLTLPVAYIFKGLVFGNTFGGAMEDYWIGVTERGLLLSFWKLWIPVQFLVFAVVPVHLRIPFSSMFSFLWTVLLSRIANSSSKE